MQNSQSKKVPLDNNPNSLVSIFLDEGMEAKEEKGKRYPQVIYHLAMYLGQTAKSDADYRRVSDICDEGRKVCIETGHLWFLPSILMVKADARLCIGDANGCKRLLVQSYHVLEACEMYRNMDIIKDYVVEKKLDIVF